MIIKGISGRILRLQSAGHIAQFGEVTAVNGGEPFGYLAYYVKDGMFLSKLYLLKEFRGRGYSRLAVDMLKNVCKAKNLHRIWLQVDRKNTESDKAYRALGFNVIYEYAADIGEGYVMDDYFMELTVN